MELFVGGPAGTHWTHLAGVEVRAFSLPTWFHTLSRSVPTALQPLGVVVRRKAWQRALATLPSATAADVIHVFGLSQAAWAVEACGGPVVGTVVGLHKHPAPTLVRDARDRMTLVAVGEAQARRLREDGYVVNAIIPPGLDLVVFTPGDKQLSRRIADRSAARKLVLFVGRLNREKNAEILLRAFAGMSGEARATDLLIIGDGPAARYLHQLSKELGIDSATTFLPFVPHEVLPTYYRSADVVVVPTLDPETFCMTALEAIACSAPVVVSTQIPEISRLFPFIPTVDPRSVESVRDRLREALSGNVVRIGASRQELGRFDWRRIADRYLQVYQSALRRPDAV